jgi:hypothetical protein
MGIEFECKHAIEEDLKKLKFTFCNKRKYICNAFYSIEKDKWIC